MPAMRAFGPSQQSVLAMRGFRFVNEPDGALPVPPEPVEPPAPAAPAPTPPAQETTDWKAEARKWEDRAKENKAAADKLAEYEEAQKTEQQKLEDRAARAEKLAAEKEMDALRARVALEKKLTPSQEKRLIGTTREELLADADALLADLGATPPAVPQPDPSIGPKTPPKPVGLGASIPAHYDAKAT